MAKRKYESKIAVATKNFVVDKEGSSDEPSEVKEEILKEEDKKPSPSKADTSKKAEAPKKEKEAPVKKPEKALQIENVEKTEIKPETVEALREEEAPIEQVAAAEKPARNITKKLGRKKIRKEGDKQLSLFVDADVYEWLVSNLRYGDTMGAYVNGVLRKAMEADR